MAALATEALRISDTESARRMQQASKNCSAAFIRRLARPNQPREAVEMTGPALEVEQGRLKAAALGEAAGDARAGWRGTEGKGTEG